MKHKTVISATLSALLFILAVPVMPAEDYEQYEKARRAYADGDYQTALRLFKPLAEAGDPDAQFSLGLMYDNGLGVNKNRERAEFWFNKACPIPTTAPGENSQDR